MSVHVTQHALDRYVERVAPVGFDAARALIEAASPAIETAAAFGGHIVRLGNGAKLILRGRGRVRVVTVLAPGAIDHGDRLELSHQPICCAQCGLRCGHPIARACTRTDCALPHSARCANDGGRQ